MLLYIVRHGLTPWNHLHKAQGSADIPLAQEGIDLARRTGEALMDVKFDILQVLLPVRDRLPG